jgi:mannose-6-phosphate isomerase-like protein (cupin superfamily)
MAEYRPGLEVRRLLLKPGERILASRGFAPEHWVVIAGNACVTLDGRREVVRENQSTFIRAGAVPEVECIGTVPLDILAIQSAEIADATLGGPAPVTSGQRAGDAGALIAGGAG